MPNFQELFRDFVDESIWLSRLKSWSGFAYKNSRNQCVNDSFIQITKRKYGEIATAKSCYGLHSSDFLSIVQHSSSPFAHQRICLPCVYLQETSKDPETTGNGSDFTSEFSDLNHVQKQFQQFESRARSRNSPAIGPIHGSITSAGPSPPKTHLRE